MNKLTRRDALKKLAAVSLLGITVPFEAVQARDEKLDFYLKHQYSGRFVCSGETENGGALWLWSPIPHGHELRYQFRLKFFDEGYFSLQHRYSGKYVCSGDRENGGALWLWGPIPKGDEPRYQFHVELKEGGYPYLQHRYSGKYVCSGDRENGGALWLWSPVPKGDELRYRFEGTNAP